MQVSSAEADHLSPQAAQAILEMLPQKIRFGLLTYAQQAGQPLEAVLEMAIAGFLDEDAISFSGCNPVAVAYSLK